MCMINPQQITLYGTTWCGDCKRAKKWFDDHKVAYKDINIEEDQEALEYMQKINGGSQSVPTIVFPDGSILIEPSNFQLEEQFAILKKKHKG